MLVVVFEGFQAFFDRQGGDGQPATRPRLSPAHLGPGQDHLATAQLLNRSHTAR
jgi:hypothetical protein